MIFQCLGITGSILLFYGLISFAVTQTSSWFAWTLLGVGFFSVLTFFIKGLSRAWQKIITLFVAFNAVWILIYAVNDRWSKPVLVGSCVLVAALIGWISKKHTEKPEWITAIILPILAAVTFVIFREKDFAPKITLVSFLLLNLVFLWISKSFLKEMFQSRGMRHGTSAAIYSMIVGFILIVVNIGSQDFHHQVDFTAAQINTLSEQTEKILGDLKSPLKITAFFESQGGEATALRNSVKNLLDRYQTHNKNIEFSLVDPDKEKILAEQKKAANGEILIEYNGQKHVTRDPTEQGITQGILKVTRTDTPTICFTTGHGEMDLGSPEDTARSISILKASLSNEGYEAKSMELISEKIPDECSIVIIAGPQQRFPESEVNVLDQYLSSGGKLIALLDPVLPNMKIEQKSYEIQTSGFDDLMKKWGIKLGHNFMLEKHLIILKGEVVDQTVRSINYGNHPIVDSLKGNQTYFDVAQSVQKLEGFAGTSYELVKSAAGAGKSWAETNIGKLLKDLKADPDGADILGPVTIAMAAEKESPKKSQLVVFGDSDFVSNRLIQSYEFNYDLFLNTVNWMSNDIQRISIRPKKMKTSALELTAKESNALFYLSIITLPMLVLIFGINLWWYRRRRG